MRKITDWNRLEKTSATSKGGVIALTHPFNNLISTGCTPWPPPEIVQKLYRSDHADAFSGDEYTACISGLGYYCDLQSINSEDAITWSVFGTVAKSSIIERRKWYAEFASLIGLDGSYSDSVDISLWRRIPHPDTLVLGGPEIDVAIQTGDTLILGEAKWKSIIDRAQGKDKNKNQLQLRAEFIQKLGTKFYTGVKHFIVIGISLHPEAFESSTPEGVSFRPITWDEVCSLSSHPVHQELQCYLEWKKEHSVF